MRIHRVHTCETLQTGQEVTFDGRSAHYLTRVLRVVVGQTIVLFNGDGHDYVAEVARPGKRQIVLSVVSRLPGIAESPLKITVVQAISRGERMDQTLQKCTELGVAAFLPLFSRRVEVRLRAEKLARRIEHWQGVVVSACEQSGRALVPEVLVPLELGDWLATRPAGLRLVLAPGAERSLPCVTEPKATRRSWLGKSSEAQATERVRFRRRRRSALGVPQRVSGTRRTERQLLAVECSRLPPQAGAGKRDTLLNESVELVVGPEGGFSDSELEQMESGGVEAVSLGPRVLRTETAAPAAVAVLQALAGDLA